MVAQQGAVGPTGAQGPQGAQGPTGPQGPTAVSANAGNTATLGTDSLIYVPGIPSGVIWEYAGSAAPTGWLFCNGAAYSRTTYAALYAALGGASSPWGQGDGSTTFNVPDKRGRVGIGAGQGTGLTNRVLGANGGEENHVLSVGELAAHNHTATQGTHSHTASDSGHNHSYNTFTTGSGVTQGPSSFFVSGGVGATTGSGTAVVSVGAASAGAITVANNGSGTAHNNMDPFLVTNFIIKT